MSGGSYNYVYAIVEVEYANRMYDAELNNLIEDLIPILKELEWWQSSDSSEEDYRIKVSNFKNKWFGKNREEMLKRLIEEEFEKKKNELLKML